MKKQYSVMLVDDREVFRRQIKRLPYFCDDACRFQIVWEAGDGREALKMLRQNHADVILTDIKMPLLDGLELLKISKAENLSRCVILLSEYTDFSYAKEAIVNGAFDYLVKPIENDKIKETFNRAYSLLETTRQNKPSVDIQIDDLVEKILSNDLNGISICSNQVFHYAFEKNEKSEYRLKQEELAQEISAGLENQYPYLSYYCDPKLYLNPEKSGIIEDSNSLKDMLVRLSEKVHAYVPQTKNESVKQVCWDILSNPDGETDFNRIAENRYLNGKYVSSQMKQEIGMSANKFIAFVKMERAKYLMQQTNMKMYEISQRLGYADNDYFSKVFRKVTGESPRSFREKEGQ